MHQRTLFGTAATMVGVCLTAIGLILVVERLSSVRMVSRVVLGVDSFIYLAAAMLSFGAMRSYVRGRPSRLGEAADVVMLLGLIATVVVCAILLFTLA